MAKVSALFLITARAGSKRVPGKNALRLNGVPLLAFKRWAIDRSRLSVNSRTILSTDDAGYARLARHWGIEAPFLRPKRLATDRASSIDVVLHAMRFVESQGERYDVLVLIEPTSPFLLPGDIDGCYGQMVRAGAEAAITVSQQKIRSGEIGPLDAGGRLGPLLRKLTARHNGRPAEFTPNGVLYMSGWDAMKRRQSFYHARTVTYITPPQRSVEIDTPMDLLYAQAYARTAEWRRAARGSRT